MTPMTAESIAAKAKSIFIEGHTQYQKIQGLKTDENALFKYFIEKVCMMHMA